MGKNNISELVQISDFAKQKQRVQLHIGWEREPKGSRRDADFSGDTNMLCKCQREAQKGWHGSSEK